MMNDNNGNNWEVQIRISGMAQVEAALGEARRAGTHLRAPHHSASEAALFAELALAAGGVLLLDSVEHFRPAVLPRLLHTWVQMPARPILHLSLGEDLPTERWVSAVSHSAVGCHPAVTRITDQMRARLAEAARATAALQALGG